MLVYEQALRRVERDLDQSLRDIDFSEQREAELRVALDAAREAFELSEAAYGAGLGTNLDRVTAQAALLQAELASATEQFDQQLLRIELLRRVGLLRERLLDVTHR
jgi:outer membrane protein TolC